MASCFIPNSTYSKMKAKGVTENEVDDVWNSGEHFKMPSGQEAIKRTYSSRGEIGLTYAMMSNGKYMITGVWRR